jgi:ABC-type transport system substrate-binding protein
MEVLAKEHQESPEAEKKLLGTGPFTFVEYNPPVVMRYKRNPDYHRQPYPYFDSIDRLGTSDKTKQIADFTSRQSHMTFWYWPEERDQIKKQRSDAKYWAYIPGSPQMVIRNDQPPFNDKRVRQALNMSYDRKAVIEAVANGETEPDQWLTYGGEYWNFRKPKDMGALVKYFEYRVQDAKQLLSAAGVSLPIKVDELSTWNATVLGQKYVDHVVLMTSHWRSNGILDANVVEKTFGQQVSTAGIGNYKDMYWTPNTVGTNPLTGLDIRNAFWSPPEGIKGPPTTNTSYTNVAELSDLVLKQLSQRNKEERIQTFRRIEEILAEDMPRLPGIPYLTTWFGEPGVMNMQTPREAYNGATPYMKYWWFENGKAP